MKVPFVISLHAFLRERARKRKHWYYMAQAVGRVELVGKINAAKGLPADNQQLLKLVLC